jgi:hypothetical protein
MRELEKNISIEIAGLTEAIEAAVERALAKGKPEPRLFTTKEAAAKLNIDESWLAVRARANQIPHRMLGHYRYFSQQDIDEIIAMHYVPVVHIANDEQGILASAEGPRIVAEPACEKAGGDGDGSGAVGQKRATDLRADRALYEAPARKKEKGEIDGGTQE